MNTEVVLATVTVLDVIKWILIAVIFGIMYEYDIREKVTKGMVFAMAGVAFVYWLLWL